MSFFSFRSKKKNQSQAVKTNEMVMVDKTTKSDEQYIRLQGEYKDIHSKVTEASEVLHHQLDRLDFFENHIDDILTSSNAAIDYLLREWDMKEEEWNVTVLSEETKQWAVEATHNFSGIVEEMVTLQGNVNDTVEFSSALQEQSKDMSRAVEYISHISESTKILALNASIESARAGEYGRSFGVVAQEVRKLADNSKRATTDILTIIEGIQRDTEKSVEMFAGTDVLLSTEVAKMQQLNAQMLELGDRSQHMVTLSNHADSYIGQQRKRVYSAVNKLEVIRLNIVALKRLLSEQREAVEKVLKIFDENKSPTFITGQATIQSVYETFYKSLKNEEVQLAVRLIRQELEQGRSAEHLLHDVVERAVLKLGAEQIDRRVPLSEIYINSRIIQLSLDELVPRLEDNSQVENGTIVIGNAFGDYHALGKKIICSFLKLGGFRVIDLGMSVANETFIDVAKKEKADIVAMSALILHSAEEIQHMRGLLKGSNMSHVKILVGGAPFLFDPDLYRTYDADATANTGIEAIRVAKKLLHML